MIWCGLMETWPDEAYIHPLYEGQGWNGRQYRPVWHAVQSTIGYTGEVEA